MNDVGIEGVERCPTIELVACVWWGHYRNASVNRARDPKTIYWPIDIMEEILEDMENAQQEEEDMTKILRVGKGNNLRWTPHTFVSDGFSTRHVRDGVAMKELQARGIWPTEEQRISWRALRQLVDDPDQLPSLGF